jgi:hypothetical protein
VKALRLAAALILAGAAAPAFGGPPYLTDDPVPTDPGHWEIYAFTAAEGHRSILDDETGFDVNYGATAGVQMTATLPLNFSRAPLESWRVRTGDVELGIKYRFINDKRTGFSAALFPRVILPTAAHDKKAQLLLPLWIEKDFATGTSLFGGGGYEFNPGSGNRDFWQAGVALTQELDKNVWVGAEVTRQGPDTIGGTAKTDAGAGATVKLSEHRGLLFSAGPTWAEHRVGYHVYASLGLFL